jgi:hypothetical protein
VHAVSTDKLKTFFSSSPPDPEELDSPDKSMLDFNVKLVSSMAPLAL